MERRQLLKLMGLMMGGFVSPSMTRALQAAEGGNRAPRKSFFYAEARRQVEAVSELIIPTTDTPGAIAAGVPDFVEMMVAEWYGDTERKIFLEGLRELDGWCQDKHGCGFVDCDTQQQTAALKWSESQAASYGGGGMPDLRNRNRIDEHTPFYSKIRELVIAGYYTSEVGARQEHRLFVMTPHFDGDYDLARSDGRQWSY